MLLETVPSLAMGGASEKMAAKIFVAIASMT